MRTVGKSVFLFRTETVWNVWLWTSDMRGAGTDANVFMTLYGDKGKTDEVPLGNATDNFEQGQLDKFKVSSDHSSLLLSKVLFIFTEVLNFFHVLPPCWAAYILCLAVLNHMRNLIIAMYSNLHKTIFPLSFLNVLCVFFLFMLGWTD